MKKIGLILILGIIALAPLSAQDYKGMVSFQSSELREEGGSLVADLAIHIHSGAIAKCESMRLTPELTDGRNRLALPYVEIQGKYRGRLNDRWETLRSKRVTYTEPYATVRVNEKHGEITDELVSYRIDVPYERWMDNARLVVHQEIIGCYNEFRLFTFAVESSVSHGAETVVTESYAPYMPMVEVVMVEPVPETKLRTKQGEAYLDFPDDQALTQQDSRHYPGGQDAAGGNIFYDRRTTSRSVQMQDQDPYGYGYASSATKHRSRQGEAYLDFPVNQTTIYPNFRRNPEELAKIEDIFNDIRNSTGVQIEDLYIHGYASPEGGYENNDRLARGRAFALKSYMQRRFGLSEKIFRVDYTPEDWGGLRSLVAGSDVAYRNQIIDIIDRSGSLDARKNQLKSLGGGSVWRMMLGEMFPPLRRVEYRINYSVRDFTTEEVVSIIGKQDELLSHRELYLGARSFGKGTPQYEEIIIDRVLRFFPDDPDALSNAAALLIARGDTATALSYLQRAGNSPAAQNNLGALYLQMGELDKAEPLLRSAAAAGIQQAQFNLEQLRLKREDNARIEWYQNR